MRGAVEYKGIWLAPTSHAFGLHSVKDFARLDKHLKTLDDEDKKRTGAGK